MRKQKEIVEISARLNPKHLLTSPCIAANCLFNILIT
nr:MAG TPA: hypothetical protein [Caudoviricetes sp.]